MITFRFHLLWILLWWCLILLMRLLYSKDVSHHFLLPLFSRLFSLAYCCYLRTLYILWIMDIIFYIDILWYFEWLTISVRCDYIGHYLIQDDDYRRFDWIMMMRYDCYDRLDFQAGLFHGRKHIVISGFSWHFRQRRHAMPHRAALWMICFDDATMHRHW